MKNKKRLYFSLLSPLIASLFLVSSVTYFSLNIATLSKKSSRRLEEAECMRISPFILREYLSKGVKQESLETFHSEIHLKITLNTLKMQEGYYQITICFFSHSRGPIFENTYYVF